MIDVPHFGHCLFGLFSMMYSDESQEANDFYDG